MRCWGAFAVLLSLPLLLWGQPRKGEKKTPSSSGPLKSLLTVRLKDIARVQWGLSLPLFGYGLVVGLEGTGDSRQIAFTIQSVVNMLRRFGLTVDPARLQLRNVAAVIVTATLPPHVKPGDRIDVLVAAIGDARSLQGGVLLQTPLQAADGKVYAIAQGPISIGGFNVQALGTRAQKNHPTAGRVVNGALIIQAPSREAMSPETVEIRLIVPDITNAVRVAATINEKFGDGCATAISPSTVQVHIPDAFSGQVTEFLASLEQLPVRPDMGAKVVINERTGTVVMGGKVRLLPVVIAHGALRIEIQPEIQVVQPPPLSQGQTVVTAQAQVRVEERPIQVTLLRPGDTIEDLVRALQALRVTPRDLIAILQALKQAGALLAELEVQ